MKHSPWRVCVLAELHRSWVSSKMPSLFCTCAQKCVIRMMILNSHWQLLLAEVLQWHWISDGWGLSANCSDSFAPGLLRGWDPSWTPHSSLKPLEEWFGVGSEMQWGDREVPSSACVLVCGGWDEKPCPLGQSDISTLLTCPGLAAGIQNLPPPMVELSDFSRLFLSMDLFWGVCLLKTNRLKYRQVPKHQRLVQKGAVIPCSAWPRRRPRSGCFGTDDPEGKERRI